MLAERDLFLLFSWMPQFQCYKQLIKSIREKDCNFQKLFYGKESEIKQYLTRRQHELFKEVKTSIKNADLTKIKNSLKRYEINFAAYCDSDYPPMLKEIDDPPFCIFYKGDIKILQEKKRVAIIGTRNPTYYGLNITKKIAHSMADYDVMVISGMALGIDSAAHQGALEKKGGKTAAVLGTGLNVIYPPSNEDLFFKIINSTGVVLTEYLPSTDSFPWNFPQRNRIISALSHAVIVVEGNVRSGALITAKMAVKQGKPLFALPGPVDSPVSNGPNLLIKSRAADIYTSVNDVLEKICAEKQMNLNLENEDNTLSELTLLQKELYKYFSVSPLNFDTLLEISGKAVRDLSTNLSILELKGLIEKMPGGYVRK